MKSRIIKLKLSAEDCRKLKKKLKAYKNKLLNINYEYMKACLEWISDRSRTLLYEDDTFEPSEISDIFSKENCYVKQDLKNPNRATLIYCSEIVAWVEFGTGIVGQSDPHPLANQGVTYNYAVGDKSGNAENNFTWVWENPLYDNEKHATQGYVGKQFIYKAIKDFINEKQAIKIYKQKYEQIEKEIFDD